MDIKGFKVSDLERNRKTHSHSHGHTVGGHSHTHGHALTGADTPTFNDDRSHEELKEDALRLKAELGELFGFQELDNSEE